MCLCEYVRPEDVSDKAVRPYHTGLRYSCDHHVVVEGVARHKFFEIFTTKLFGQQSLAVVGWPAFTPKCRHVRLTLSSAAVADSAPRLIGPRSANQGEAGKRTAWSMPSRGTCTER